MSKLNSHNYRKNARKYTIVVTDGKCDSKYEDLLLQTAAELRGGSVHAVQGQEERQVWSIGIGRRFEREEIEELEKISGKKQRVLLVDDYKNPKIDEVN